MSARTSRLVLAVLALGAGTALGPVRSAAADTIYVDVLCGDDAADGSTPVCGPDFRPMRTIQAAIDLAMTGDEVVVARGTYHETIDYGGDDITVRSAEGPEVTIIDAAGTGSVVTFVSGASPDARLIGFTLTGGTGTSSGPGVTGGGGIYCDVNSDPTVIGCIITGNNVNDKGGGVYVGASSGPSFFNCVIFDNVASYGGGVALLSSAPADPLFINCTIVGNTATFGPGPAGGMQIFSGRPRIVNCIFWSNTPGSIYDHMGEADIDYCDVEGGYPSGTNIVNSLPLFVDEAAGNLRLNAGSECLDFGENGALPGFIDTDIDGNARIFPATWDPHPEDRVDLGAYERGYIVNDRTNRSSTSFPLAFANAADDDTLRASYRAFEFETDIDYAGARVTVRSTAAIDQPETGLITMADDTRLATDGGLDMTLHGGLEVPAGDAVTLEAGAVVVETTGTVQIDPASVLTVDAAGGFTCRGAMTAYGGAVVTSGGLTVDTAGTLTGYGNFMGVVFVDGVATFLADTQVIGDLLVGGTTTIQGGTLTVIGDLTATGSVLAGTTEGAATGAGSETVLVVFGNLATTTSAALRVPGPGPRLTVAGAWDVAIDDHLQFNMAETDLWMNALAGGQTFEVMGLDMGSGSLGLDRFLPGAYPIGRVRIGPGATTVDIVDNHDNDGLGQTQCEALYVQELIIDEGATLNTNGCRVYYGTLVFLGAVDNAANLVEIEDAPIVACPGDTNGDDDVNVNDLNNVILDWGTDGTANGGDVTGDLVVDVNDLVDIITFWGPCDPP